MDFEGFRIWRRGVWSWRVFRNIIKILQLCEFKECFWDYFWSLDNVTCWLLEFVFLQYSMLYMRKYSYEDIIVEIEEISSYTCKRLLIKVSVFKILILTILYSYFETIIIIMYLTRNFTVKYFFNLSNSKWRYSSSINIKYLKI